MHETESDIDDELLRAIHSAGSISFSDLVDNVTSERFTQLFYSVDRLTRLGIIRMVRDTNGQVLVPAVTWSEALQALGFVPHDPPAPETAMLW